MTSVSELMVTSANWTLLVPVMAALVGASAGGLMAIIGGLSAAAVTQHFTRNREDRARIIQQRREVLVGAWSAHRDYITVVAEAIAAEAAASVHADAHRRAESLYHELVVPPGLLSPPKEHPFVPVPPDVAEKLRRDRDERGEKYSEAAWRAD